MMSDDDFEIKSKIYSFNLRLVLKHILHSQDVFFRNLLFTKPIQIKIFSSYDPVWSVFYCMQISIIRTQAHFFLPNILFGRNNQKTSLNNQIFGCFNR